VLNPQVLTALDNEERRLFADRIRALDRRIMPGVSKLNWVSDKLALEFYCKEARKHCHLADNCVTGFKAGLCRIDALYKSIAEDLLIDVEKKKLYEIAEFEAVQGRHHHMVRKIFHFLPPTPATACLLSVIGKGFCNPVVLSTIIIR
jgi:dynein heavy chain